MKFKINKVEFNALSDEQKAMYSAAGDDYVIKADGMPDFDGLQKTVADLTAKIEAGEKEKAEQRAAADAAAAEAKQKLLDADRKKGDFGAIEEDYKKRIADLEARQAEASQKAVDHIKKLTLDSQIDSLASKLAGGNDSNAKLIRPFVAERFSLDGDVDSGFVVRVTKDGKPTAMNVTELEAEFRGSGDFKSVIAAPKSSGTGANSAFSDPSARPQNMDGGNSPVDPRERMASRAEQIASGIE